jgi:hypothetical protein
MAHVMAEVLRAVLPRCGVARAPSENEGFVSPSQESPVTETREWRSFHDPEYLEECRRAIEWLRTEVYVYHDPTTPDTDDPAGVVNATIKRLNELHIFVRTTTKGLSLPPDGAPGNLSK